MAASKAQALSGGVSAITQPVFKQYYRLTKPGIVYSNVMTAAAGYLVASRLHIQWVPFLALLLGTALIIASGCVFNNYLDRGIDARMKRTQKRATVTGVVSGRSALLYASCLGLLGFVALSRTNQLTMVIGVLAIFSYVVVYGVAKRRTVHGTLVGTLPGAASLVAGSTVATGQLGLLALLLFLVMVAWQMAHFYAIATFRRDDYAAAGLPIWSVKKGIPSTKIMITVYVAAFIVTVLLLPLSGYVGYLFAAVMAVVGFYWLFVVLQGFKAQDDARWARQTFFCSLIVLLSLAVMLPVGTVLP